MAMKTASSLPPAAVPLLKTSPLPIRADASSSRRTAIHADPVLDKILPHSDRSPHARKSIQATSSALPLPALSSIQNASSRDTGQDAVYVALTTFRGRDVSWTGRCEKIEKKRG